MSVLSEVTVWEEDIDLFEDINSKDPSSFSEGSSIKLFDCFGEIDVDYTKSPYRKSPALVALKHATERLPNIHDSEVCQVFLFQKKWDKGAVIQSRLEDLFKMARKDVAFLTSCARPNHPIFFKSRLAPHNISLLQLRKNCVDWYWFIDEYLSSVVSCPKYDWCFEKFLRPLCSWMEMLQKHLGPLTLLPESIYLYPCNAKGNKCEQPSYHLFHMHLELRWLHLNILLKLLGFLETRAVSSNSQLMETLSISKVDLSCKADSLLFELVDLAYLRFEKVYRSGCCRSAPFSCGCVQDLWVYLSRFYSMLWSETEGRGFWCSLCGYLEKINGSAFEDLDIGHDRACQGSGKSLKILFSLWILYNLSASQKSLGLDVSNNHALFENVFKSLVSDEVTESEMRTALGFIEQLCIQMWDPKVELIVILWERFYKKLNNSFYVPGSPIDSIATLSKTASGLLRLVRSLLEKRSNVTNSYQHFIRIVGLHLQRTKHTPRHWKVIKGRIFSKISGPKLGTLSQLGEHHVVLMFLMLAVSVSVSQVEKEFMEVITTIKRAKGRLSSELLHGQMAFIMLSINEKHDASKMVQVLVEHVNSINPLHGFNDLKGFTTEVEELFNMDESFGFGLHLFLDTWILSYLTCCAPSESNRLLESISVVVNRLKMLSCLNSPDQETILFIERLWEHLHPYFNSMPPQMPLASANLAASMVILFTNTDNHERGSALMNIFISKDNSDIWLTRRFIVRLLSNESVISLLSRYNKLIIKAWIRCSILCSDKHSTEMRSLTRHVLSLDEINSTCPPDSANLIESPDPLFLLCSAFHDKFESTENIFQKQNLREQFTSYLDGIDRWLKVSSTSQNSELIQNLYKACGNIVKLCPNLIYTKSRPNTVLQQIVDAFLLPPAVRNPEYKVSNITVQAVKETLHLFLQGLHNLSQVCIQSNRTKPLLDVDVNCIISAAAVNQDSYITRIFKELITLYIPRCVTLPSSLNNLNFSKLGLVDAMSSFDCSLRCSVFDAVSGQFLKKKMKMPHHFALHALQFLKETLERNNHNSSVVKCFIKRCFERIGDVVMFCDPTSAALSKSKDVLRKFLNADILRDDPELMDTLSHSLAAMCNEHLAWSSRQLFDFIIFVSNDAPDVVVRFLPQLLDIIKHVEKKRGVGYDKNLRLGLERIESTLRTIKCQASS